MDTQEAFFTHTDGRVFTYTGAAPHVTRDGRCITLKLWETTCTTSGCLTPVVVRTATETPWLWANFAPAKFCEAHRTLARKVAQTKLIKARADGLTRWRNSPEGKAALEQRKLDSMGDVERALYEAVRDLSLVDGAARWADVCQRVRAAMGEPAQGKRDTRGQRISRALWSLREKGRLHYRSEVVTLLR